MTLHLARPSSAFALIFGVGLFGLVACKGTSAPVPPRTHDLAAQGSAEVRGSIQGRIETSKVREHAVELVERASRYDQDPQLRANAVEAALSSPARFRTIIERGLTDPSQGVRSVAAAAVGKAGIKELAPNLRAMLRDPSHHVRASAIFSLAKLGETVDQSPLAEMLLNDNDPWVSRHVAYLLGELGNKSALPLLNSAAKNRVPVMPPAMQRPMQLQLAESMVKLGDAGQKPVLRAALFPSQPEELESAAMAAQIMGELNDREAMGQLCNLAAYRNKSGQNYPAEVRLAIAGALAKMGNKDGASIADELRQSPEYAVRAQAASVYGGAGGVDHWAKLDALMRDTEPRVQIAAAAAVLKSSGRDAVR